MDYIKALLLDPEIPTQGKSLVLKLYGVNEEHLMQALKADDSKIRASVYGHQLCNESFLDNLGSDYNNLSSLNELIKQRPELFTANQICKLYPQIMDWSDKDLDSSKDLLNALHGNANFSALTEDELSEIKDLATSDRGVKLGLNTFFPPDPSENDDPLIFYRDPNSEALDENGFRVRITQYPNGNDASKPTV